jgi:hypothetical protein
LAKERLFIRLVEARSHLKQGKHIISGGFKFILTLKAIYSSGLSLRCAKKESAGLSFL